MLLVFDYFDSLLHLASLKAFGNHIYLDDTAAKAEAQANGAYFFLSDFSFKLVNYCWMGYVGLETH